MRKNWFNQDAAVSPVIGVLLMLVVTIIIAAIVSGFAGGLAGSEKAAPQASFDIKTQYPVASDGVSVQTTGFDLYFIHNGGDTIDTSECEIITFLTLPDDTVVQHKQTPDSSPVWSPYGTNNDRYIRFPYFRDSMLSPSQSKTLAQVQAGEESSVWWGEQSVSTGQVMRVSSLQGVAAFLGLVDEDSLVPYDATAYQTGMNTLNYTISNKTQLEVKMLHIPSQKYIFEKTISMEG